MKIIPYIILLACAQSFAGPWFDVSELYIDAHQYAENSNDPIQNKIGRKLDKGLNLGLNVDFFGSMYFNNLVDSRTSCIHGEFCQFSEISYNFQVGARIASWLDLLYSHKSSHAIDSRYSYDVEDSFGIRLYLINTNAKESFLR